MDDIVTTNIQLSRADWLHLAMEILRNSGVSSISIVKLAETLQVTRGSFYHHFSGREDLLTSMLEYWENAWTVNIKASVKEKALAPTESLKALILDIRNNNAADYDAPFRAWALHDPLARRVLERVDNFRLGYIRSLFEAAGFRGIDAENRARLLLHYEMSDPAFFATRDRILEKKLIDERLKLLLQPVPDSN
jgi:AcrR family transcriptional regulator